MIDATADRIAAHQPSIKGFQQFGDRCHTLHSGVEPKIIAVFKFWSKVKSRSTNPRLLIALHSPKGLRETGLRMCPSEKRWDSDPDLTRAVPSLPSGLLRNYREKWAPFAYFEVRGGGISLHFRLRGGASVIRTHVTVLNPATSDVYVTCGRCST